MYLSQGTKKLELMFWPCCTITASVLDICFGRVITLVTSCSGQLPKYVQLQQMACMCVIHTMVYMGHVYKCMPPHMELDNSHMAPHNVFSCPTAVRTIPTMERKAKVSCANMDKLQNTLKGDLMPQTLPMVK